MATFSYPRVYIQPKRNVDLYADEIDVTDFIAEGGVGDIISLIDSEDYDFGIFSFGDLQITFVNSGGEFNDGSDWRSIFDDSRDLAKVRVTIAEEDESDGSVTETNIFRGLINDEASKTDLENEVVIFNVLSEDSILRKAKVSSGVVLDNSLVSVALNLILNQPIITDILSVSPSNINPANDFLIGDGSFFDNLPVRDAVSDLLLASNSVLTITTSGAIEVKPRTVSSNPTLNLYGKYDLLGRENIIGIFNFNNGFQRVFTSVKVGTIEANSGSPTDEFGFRQKSVSVDYVSDSLVISGIAQALLQEFENPKEEMEVLMPITVGKGAAILDPVSVNYPLDIVPPEGSFITIAGSGLTVDGLPTLPFEYGSTRIDDGIKFKILEIKHSISELTTTLKIRQSGTTQADGFF